MESRLRICVITSPRPKAGVIPLSNLVDVLSSLCTSLYLITGNEGSVVCRNRKNIHGYWITYRPRAVIPARIVNYVAMQLGISYRLVKLRREVNLCIFFMGEGLLLPVLLSRLLGKNVIVNLGVSPARMLETSRDPLSKTFEFLEALNYRLSSGIFTYSRNLVKEWNLGKYKNKVWIAYSHFLDFDQFRIQNPLSGRNNLIGYIGRLSAEKGISNFMEAIPRILEREDSVKILIGGDGQLGGEIEQYLNKKGLYNKANFVGWIPHDELPEYLNALKLLVLPSYAEGLPNIMLEAMACGTPVLATSIGAIPDVIRDGETGFIMADNSPECIAEEVMRVLNHPDLERVTRNARALVEKDYTYQAAVERYRNTLGSLE